MPSRQQQRETRRERAAGTGEELEPRDAAAHVAARLDALDDRRVGPGRVGGAGLGDRAALVHPEAAGPPPRPAPEGDDDVGLGRRLEPVAAREGQQHVDGDRAGGQRPRRAQLAADRGGAVDRDRPQPARLGDRRGELVAAEAAAHSGLDDGRFDAESGERGHRSSLCLGR